MIKLTNKVLFFIIGASVLLMSSSVDGTILLILAVVSIASIQELYVQPLLSVLYFPIMILNPQFLAFTPLFILDCPKIALLLTPLILLLNPQPITIIISALAVVLRFYASKLQELLLENKRIQDESRLKVLQQNAHAKNLTQSHASALNRATLEERNRIARDIHDSVGHQLSSSIIQVGALSVLNEQETLNESIRDLRETLDSAMTSIRTSVHHLYNESVNFNKEIETLFKAIPTIEVDYAFELDTNPNNETIDCILLVLKEGIQNINKHSNGNHVIVHVKESMNAIQVLLHDNGTHKHQSNHFGMGISNMKRRVLNLDGIFNAQFNDGFRIYLSIPKERKL